MTEAPALFCLLYTSDAADDLTRTKVLKHPLK